MTYILALTYLNDACFLSLNVDDKKYQIALKMAQENLEFILGQEFYEQIVSQYPNFTGASDNSTLYTNYIKDYLAWQTYMYYLKFANQDSTPTGIREHNDDNSTLVSDVKMYALEKNVLERVTYYRGRIISYIKLEQSKDSLKFPLYTDVCQESFSFGITSVDKKSDALFKVNKSITTND